MPLPEDLNTFIMQVLPEMKTINIKCNTCNIYISFTKNKLWARFLLLCFIEILETQKKVKEIGTFCDSFKKTAPIEKRI